MQNVATEQSQRFDPGRFVIDADGAAVMRLANGEVLRFYVGDDGLGVSGHSVKVVCDRTLVVIPSAGNSLVLTTPKAMQRAEQLRAEAVAARDAASGKTAARAS